MCKGKRQDTPVDSTLVHYWATYRDKKPLMAHLRSTESEQFTLILHVFRLWEHEIAYNETL